MQTRVPGFGSEAPRPLGRRRRRRPSLTLGGHTDTLHSLFSPRLASGSLPLPRKPNSSPATALCLSAQAKSCRVVRMGSVTPLQVVAVAEKGSGDSRVYETRKGNRALA